MVPTGAGLGSGAERLAVLDGPPASYLHGRTVHEVFLRIADRHRDDPALVAGDRTVSYAGLAAAARRAAMALDRVGVSGGDVVPVLLPRSPELVASLLGILLRGAAYAVLDARWPAERLDSMAAAVGARMVVGDRSVAGLPTWCPTVDLFDDGGPVPTDPVTGSGEDVCCVFFTSGSTGTPKPILSPHRATTRLFGAGALHGEFGPSARMPQWAPLPWDGLTLELWSMLLTGGTSVLHEERLPSTASLRKMIGDGVDSMWLTSSLFNLIVDEDIDAFGGLRQLWVGGERLSTAHVRRFLAHHPAIRLVNGYGPAESCVFVATHEVTTADCDDPDGVPLGDAVAGTSVFVLDGDRLCRRDEPGEICVGGDGLAAGYLGDPELTGRKFVTLHVAGRTVRLYRTGDRGAVGPDGLLRFLGRVDRQVKIRGHRVEPGEVEAHLRAVDAVMEAVVLPDVDASGICTGLTGYYVPTGQGAGHAPDAVRASLLAKAPRQLVPDRLVPLPRIPVTPNGKADHAALRAVDAPAPAARPAPDPAADPVLAGVAGVVAGVTGAPADAATRLDDGTVTSLQVLRLCMALGGRFGVELPPEEAFAARTVADLADLVRHGEGGADPARPEGPEVPLADTQVGFLVEHEMRPDSKAGHCLIGYLARGDFDPAAFRAAMTDVQDRHPALRSRYEPDLEPFLVPEKDSPVQFAELGEFTDLAAAWAVARTDLLRPLDLGAAEVWRGNHARFADQHLISLVIHHVSYDGWSESVLADDLSVAYAARLAGRAPDFPVPAPSLTAAVTDRRAEAGRRAASRSAGEYWVRLLADLPEHRAIRGAVECEPVTVAVRTHGLAASVLDGVDRVARRLGTTRFPVLVAAYARALADVLGQEDFGVGVPVSVRRRPSQADVVTCLVDTVCLRLAPHAGPALEDAVLRAHRQMTAGRGTHALAFPDVVRAVNPARQRGRNPLFRTMFVLQDNREPRLVVPGAEVRVHRPPVPEPMSELLVEVWPDATGAARVDATFYPECVPPAAVTASFTAYEQILVRLADG